MTLHCFPVSDLHQMHFLIFIVPSSEQLPPLPHIPFQPSNMEVNGLDKFLPKSIAAKRRRRKQGSIAETTSSNDEAGTGGAEGASSTPRGRSIISREQTAGTTAENAADEGGEGASLISYDSDPEV